jgi:hypothetical protein
MEAQVALLALLLFTAVFVAPAAERMSTGFQHMKFFLDGMIM